MSQYVKFYKSVQDSLDKISPSFCAAKWTQVTFHLHTGKNHSCHHPRPHQILPSEVIDNPSALHNTKFKKEQRKKMLEGERPSECQYCWNVEDLPEYKEGKYFSDRITKSAMHWSTSAMDKIKEVGYIDDINPTYVEVNFSHLCNFKCSYCSPTYSSRWMEESMNHGSYPTSTKFNSVEWLSKNSDIPYHHAAANPYVEAFWKWWPDLVKTLKVFRITGGEPLLIRDTYKTLDFLYKNPQPELELAINTNGCVPDIKIDTFIAKAKELLSENKIKSLRLFVSVDSAGKPAEYGRFGLNYNRWLKNVNRFLTELPSVGITIMSTTNIFSITNYKKLLEDMLEIKKRYTNENRKSALHIDIAILRFPHHQCVSILTDEYKTYMDSSLEFMKQNVHRDEDPGFYEFEISRMERFIEFMKSEPNKNENIGINTARKDFFMFVNEHDKRRGTNFLQAFPELTNFYNVCKKLSEK